ncbi:MAG: peptide chain release factor N(5)-glutamine methyltransferase [Bacteroidota bacterium]
MIEPEDYPNTAKKLKQYLEGQMLSSISIGERGIYAELLIEHIINFSRTDILLDKPIQNITSLKSVFTESLERINKNEPIQYILGNTEFYGRQFVVNSNVLIPRPETEELVNLIIQENDAPNLKVLDIGTGSGCIPITLFHELNNPEVATLDVSKSALQVAKLNAEQNQSNVSFHACDILKERIPNPPYNIIVSNPPYIPNHEKGLMHDNVLKYEPASALFVEDSEPLVFYKRIADLAAKSLTDGGKLYLEINEKFGGQVKAILKEEHFHDVVIVRDMQGKDRMARGVF